MTHEELELKHIALAQQVTTLCEMQIKTETSLQSLITNVQTMVQEQRRAERRFSRMETLMLHIASDHSSRLSDIEDKLRGDDDDDAGTELVPR